MCMYNDDNEFGKICECDVVLVCVRHEPRHNVSLAQDSGTKVKQKQNKLQTKQELRGPDSSRMWHRAAEMPFIACETDENCEMRVARYFLEQNILISFY